MTELKTWALYLGPLAVWLAAVWQVGRCAARLRLPPVVGPCVAGGLLLYLAALLPGMLGAYAPMPVALALAGISAITFLLLIPFTRKERGDVATVLALAEQQQRRGSGFWTGPWTPATVVLLLAALVVGAPILEFAGDIGEHVRDPGVRLHFDAVTYSMPAIVEYYQHRTLWHLGGPFASYSHGFELIYSYPMLFFHGGVWSIVLGTAYAILFLVAAIALLGRVIGRAVRGPAGPSFDPLNIVLVSAVAVAAWVWCFGRTPYDYGKNDAFLCAALIGALAMLLQANTDDADLSETDNRRRRGLLLVLATASLGLAVATKPTALIYLPLFAVLGMFTGRRPGGQSTGVAERRVRFGRGVVIALGAAAIGGFWYVRNFIALGHITDPANTRGFKVSIAGRLSDPMLYTLHRDSILTMGAIGSIVLLAGMAWWWRRRRIVEGPGSVAIAGLIAFQLTAAVALAITPYVLFREFSWFIRLGMPLYAASGVAIAVMAAQVAALRRWNTPITGVLVTLATLAGFAYLPWHARKHSKPGLPGFETVQGLPRTGAYEWVRQLKRPHRIYSAGLRPYGLFGKDWQHEVFYDSHSNILSGVPPLDKHGLPPESNRPFGDSYQQLVATGTPQGRARMMAVMRDFNPEIIVVAVDPHDDRQPFAPPLVDWLKLQTRWLELVKEDQTAAMFRVIGDDWKYDLPQYELPKQPVRMSW